MSPSEVIRHCARLATWSVPVALLALVFVLHATPVRGPSIAATSWRVSAPNVPGTLSGALQPAHTVIPVSAGDWAITTTTSSTAQLWCGSHGASVASSFTVPRTGTCVLDVTTRHRGRWVLAAQP